MMQQFSDTIVQGDVLDCLRREKGANIAARVDRMFCLLSPEHIPCKVRHDGGNQ